MPGEFCTMISQSLSVQRWNSWAPPVTVLTLVLMSARSSCCCQTRAVASVVPPVLAMQSQVLVRTSQWHLALRWRPSRSQANDGPP